MLEIKPVMTAHSPLFGWFFKIKACSLGWPQTSRVAKDPKIPTLLSAEVTGTAPHLVHVVGGWTPRPGERSDWQSRDRLLSDGPAGPCSCRIHLVFSILEGGQESLGHCRTLTVTCPLLCWEQSQGCRKPAEAWEGYKSTLNPPAFFFFFFFFSFLN